MSGYGGSVLNERHLLVAPNWLGDVIMALPSVRAWGVQHPGVCLDVLTKPGLAALWAMCPGIGNVFTLAPGAMGSLRTGRLLRSEAHRQAHIIPCSFRSAIAPWIAHIPQRRGIAAQGRSFMLTECIAVAPKLPSPHQAWEICHLLLGEAIPASLPPPVLHPSAAHLHQASNVLGSLPRPLLGILPGAARGPSKQWPLEHVAELVKGWISQTHGHVLLMGAPSDRSDGNHVMQLVNHPDCSSIVGETSLGTLAVYLTLCNVVVANDSGGMHLAAALGTPTVGLFGHTDPTRTGPLGNHTRIIQHSDVRSRAIARNCPAARAAMARITSQETLQAALHFLHDRTISHPLASS